MKIAYVVPGSGYTFYCENCFRDFSLISGLRALGHSVTIVPLYLPLNNEEGAATGTGPLFFGAVRLYLEEQCSLLKRLPEAMLKTLNAPVLLRMAAARAGSTRAAGNEQLTLTMLRGENGSQAPEFERLGKWVAATVRPDAVIVSNMLLLGTGEAIQARCRAPVFCFAQDEDTWVNGSDPEIRDQLWETIARHDGYITRFFSLSRWYVDLVTPYVKLPPERFSLIPFGVNPDNYSVSNQSQTTPVLGYLSRFNAECGFHALTDMFCGCAGRETLPPVLSFCGGATGDDRVAMKRKLAAAGRCGTVNVTSGYGIAVRRCFLASLSVMSVPVPRPIAYGTFLIEALAAGVPVVQPATGGFREIADRFESVRLYTQGDTEAQVETLRELCFDQALRKKLGKRAREQVEELGTHIVMARAVLKEIEMAGS